MVSTHKTSTVKRFISILVGVGLAVMFIGCGSEILTYQGIRLPTPQPIARGTQPPAAWLVVNNTAIVATYGSYCYRGFLVSGCSDVGPVQGMQNLATVAIPPGTNVVVVLHTTTIQEVWVEVRSWSNNIVIDPSTVQTLNVTLTQQEPFTVFPFTASGVDQILEITVTVRQGEGATYIWRIKPQEGP